MKCLKVQYQFWTNLTSDNVGLSALEQRSVGRYLLSFSHSWERILKSRTSLPKQQELMSALPGATARHVPFDFAYAKGGEGG